MTPADRIRARLAELEGERRGLEFALQALLGGDPTEGRPALAGLPACDCKTRRLDGHSNACALVVAVRGLRSDVIRAINTPHGCRVVVGG